MAEDEIKAQASLKDLYVNVLTAGDDPREKDPIAKVNESFDTEAVRTLVSVGGIAHLEKNLSILNARQGDKVPIEDYARYTIKAPVFDCGNIAKDKSTAEKQFAIAAEKSRKMIDESSAEFIALGKTDPKEQPNATSPKGADVRAAADGLPAEDKIIYPSALDIAHACGIKMSKGYSK